MFAIKGRLRSKYWTYFTPTEPNRATCNICNIQCSYGGNTTSNLARHMKARHSEIDVERSHKESQATIYSISLDEPDDAQPGSSNNERDGHIFPKLETCLQNGSDTESEMETKKQKRSLCWSVFTKIDDSRMSCNYCNTVLSMLNGNTSNLKRHMRKKHPGLHCSLMVEELERKKQQKLIPKPTFDRNTKSSISYFSVLEKSEIPEDMLKLMEETEEKIGFIPNEYQAMSHRPIEMRAYISYYDTLMEERPGSHLTSTDKEMVFIAVSAHNKSTYFIVTHSAYFRLKSNNKILADQIAANWETADLDPRQRSILQFAMKLANCQRLMDSDFGDLQNYSLDKEDAWDIGAIVSFCSLSNRMAFLTNMMPNVQFYSMGRNLS